MEELANSHCKACEGGVAPLTLEEITRHLKKLPGWQVSANHKEIYKTFDFKNYYQVMAFVNAIAWMTHRENHHPDLEVAYNRCKVRYTTHAIDGVSENDIICALKVEKIIAEG